MQASDVRHIGYFYLPWYHMSRADPYSRSAAALG